MALRVRWLIGLGLVGAVAVAATPILVGRGPAGLLDELNQRYQTLTDRVIGSATFLGQGSGVSKGSGGAGGPQQGPPAVVTISQPLQREVTEWDEYTARLEAMESVDVRARVSGYLIEVHFKDGQLVQKGDLLFVIDPRPFERALELAQAELNQANVKVQNTTADVERGRSLAERKIISEKVFEDRTNIWREADAAVKVSQARVNSAELDLSFTRITAPISGRVSRTQVTIGNYVAGGGATSTSLTSIVSQDPIYAYFDISEANAIKYRRSGETGGAAALAGAGTDVQLALADEKGFPHAGKLDFLDNRLETGTATLRARAVVANNTGLFAPGMFARLRLQGLPKYIGTLVPDEAIGTDQTSRFVYVVGEDNQPQRRVVRLGPLVDGLRVVREGIGEQDWIVVKGLQRVRPGKPVEPKREPIKVSDADAMAGQGAPAVRLPTP